MTTVRNAADIKCFVTETLGCNCPESVFERIDYDAQWMLPDLGVPLQRLLIGNRLLIYILEADNAADLPTTLPLLVAKGQAERDLNGYNRVRVVVVTDRPEALHHEAELLFSRLDEVDEKVHLHILSNDRCLKRLTGAA